MARVLFRTPFAGSSTECPVIDYSDQTGTVRIRSDAICADSTLQSPEANAKRVLSTRTKPSRSTGHDLSPSSFLFSV